MERASLNWGGGVLRQIHTHYSSTRDLSSSHDDRERKRATSDQRLSEVTTLLEGKILLSVSQSELKKPLRLEVKRLQEFQASPVDFFQTQKWSWQHCFSLIQSAWVLEKSFTFLYLSLLPAWTFFLLYQHYFDVVNSFSYCFKCFSFVKCEFDKCLVTSLISVLQVCKFLSCRWCYKHFLFVSRWNSSTIVWILSYTVQDLSEVDNLCWCLCSWKQTSFFQAGKGMIVMLKENKLLLSENKMLKKDHSCPNTIQACKCPARADTSWSGCLLLWGFSGYI